MLDYAQLKKGIGNDVHKTLVNFLFRHLYSLFFAHRGISAGTNDLTFLHILSANNHNTKTRESMKTFECCQCQEEHTEEKPYMWGYVYPYSSGDPACKTCIEDYQGPGDEYYQRRLA